MRASDVAPTRIAAAQAAAKNFIAEQPRNVRIGVVSYGGTASVVQGPTTNHQDLLDAIDRLQLQPATAIGSGILVSLKLIFPDIEFNLTASDPRPSSPSASHGMSLDDAGKAPKLDFKPVAPGSYTSAAMVLLTDGQTTAGPDPIEAARMAADRGVRIFTLGIGTTDGEILNAGGWSMRVSLDEETLKEIARLTKGEYFYADNATALANIYKKLNFRLAVEKREMEIAPFCAAAAAVLSLLSAILSMKWFNRIL